VAGIPATRSGFSISRGTRDVESNAPWFFSHSVIPSFDDQPGDIARFYFQRCNVAPPADRALKGTHCRDVNVSDRQAVIIWRFRIENSRAKSIFACR